MFRNSMKQDRVVSHVSRLAVILEASLAVVALVIGLQGAVHAQTNPHLDTDASTALPDAPSPATGFTPASSDAGDVTIASFPRNFLHDQAAIWTSPARLRVHNLEWLVPLSAAVGISLATGRYTMTQVVSHDPGFNNANVNTSNVLIGGWIVAPVAICSYGHFHQDDHAREAGILSAESMIDGVVVEEALKQVFRRERPYIDNANGRFFQSNVGVDSSFPSSHSLIAWSAASALAGEYHSPWIQAGLYSAATSVSLTRVLGREHFPSDVLVGSALGWLIGHEVVKRHHPLKSLVAHREP